MYINKTNLTSKYEVLNTEITKRKKSYCLEEKRSLLEKHTVLQIKI